ncbi:MAG TPA: hypothetical protein VJK54_00880 [Chthoniobacterales bacterium]|nr:hypothetical protein [Chthoniobacterales bacterium]
MVQILPPKEERAERLRRMKQFYENHEDTKLSTVLAEILWTNYLHILPKTKILEEKYYDLELKYSVKINCNFESVPKKRFKLTL